MPWGDGYALPIEALIATGANAIYLANPNAPTARSSPPAEGRQAGGAFHGAVLVDEAYVDFADENCLESGRPPPERGREPDTEQGVRAGRAAVRVRGGAAAVIAEMMKVKDSYNADAISVVGGGGRALQDQAYASGQVGSTSVRSATRVTTALEAMGWNVLPSQANFVLATAPDGRGREAIPGPEAAGHPGPLSSTSPG